MQKLAEFSNKITSTLAKNGVSDEDFADLVYIAVTDFGLPEQAFRDHFGLTKGAVERWILRQNLPQPIIRPKILQWILERVSVN